MYCCLDELKDVLIENEVDCENVREVFDMIEISFCECNKKRYDTLYDYCKEVQYELENIFKYLINKDILKIDKENQSEEYTSKKMAKDLIEILKDYCNSFIEE